MIPAHSIPPRPSTAPTLATEPWVQDPGVVDTYWRAEVTASGTATIRTNTPGAPAAADFDGRDVRLARAWVWKELLSAAQNLPAGTHCTIQDELTGTHVLEAGPGIAGMIGDPVADIIDHHDETADHETGHCPAIDAAPVKRRPETTLARRVALISVLTALVVLAGVLASIWALGQVHGTTAHAPTPTGTKAGLWAVPPEVEYPVAAANLVAGTKTGGLVLFEGTTGTPVPVEGGTAPAVKDPAMVQAAAGDGLTVIGTSEVSGVAVFDGKAVAYTDKGAVLDRGPVPVLVGGTAKARTFWVFRDGKPVQVQPPAPGNSLFGGLPGGGSAWAAVGGKITYVPGTGAPRTVTLAAPAAGATVSSWLQVNEISAVVLWRSGAGQVLAEHNFAGSEGTITNQVKLAATDTATPDSGLVLLHQSGNTTAFPADPDAPDCAEPALTHRNLWCPGNGSSWTSAHATVPGKPQASGEGFALVAQEDGRLTVAAEITHKK